LASAAGRFVG